MVEIGRLLCLIDLFYERDNNWVIMDAQHLTFAKSIHFFGAS